MVAVVVEQVSQAMHYLVLVELVAEVLLVQHLVQILELLELQTLAEVAEVEHILEEHQGLAELVDLELLY
jgi:hypothetical protein